MNPVIIGNATLYLADCLEILPTLPKVDAVITDPPYGIKDAAFSMGSRAGSRWGGDNTWHAESWWDSGLNPSWGAVCERSDVVAWFGQWRKREEVERFMRHPLRAEIVWAKDCHAGPPSPLAPRDERIWVFSAAGLKTATFETSVWDQPVIPTWAHKHHKNKKPLGLMERLVSWLAPKSVLDPFMGSGTTGVAAIQAGCSFIGCEIEAANFDIACRRIEQAQAQGKLFEPELIAPQQLEIE